MQLNKNAWKWCSKKNTIVLVQLKWKKEWTPQNHHTELFSKLQRKNTNGQKMLSFSGDISQAPKKLHPSFFADVTHNPTAWMVKNSQTQRFGVIFGILSNLNPDFVDDSGNLRASQLPDPWWNGDSKFEVHGIFANFHGIYCKWIFTMDGIYNVWDFPWDFLNQFCFKVQFSILSS